jgi:hypothetical protein
MPDNDDKRAAWVRKVLFLRKFMEKRERERPDELEDVPAIRRQLTRIANSLESLEHVARWLVGVLTVSCRPLLTSKLYSGHVRQPNSNLRPDPNPPELFGPSPVLGTETLVLEDEYYGWRTKASVIGSYGR